VAHTLRWRDFRRGLLAGVVAALFGVLLTLYVLQVLGFVVLTVSNVPSIQDTVLWAYANLRLSVIPFVLILLLYLHQLRLLSRLLDVAPSDPPAVLYAERWVDISVSLFFGTGVVWTAIGMRSALLWGIGTLDQTTAAELGAFEILRRLIEGGILLALSTTIVGAVGGYVLRIVKFMVVGTRLHSFYEHTANAAAEQMDRRLQHIEEAVTHIAARSADLEGRRTAAAVREAARP